MSTGDTEYCGCLNSLDQIKADVLCNVAPQCKPKSQAAKILCTGDNPYCTCEDPTDLSTCQLTICNNVNPKEAISAWRLFEDGCNEQAGGIQAYRKALKDAEAERVAE